MADEKKEKATYRVVLSITTSKNYLESTMHTLLEYEVVMPECVVRYEVTDIEKTS